MADLIDLKKVEDEDVVTPWCYMPPECHFSSPDELKEAILAFQLTRVTEELNSDHSELLLPPVNKFEKVRCRGGKYLLVPTMLDMSYVFRGQGKFYPNCLPTLYRQEMDSIHLFLERLRCVEFELFLKQLPEVQDFERNNYKVDYLGLCQHYGLKTDVIDLTSSLEIALFFAMCDLSADMTSYLPKSNDGEYIGYIYAIATFDNGGFLGNKTLPTLLDGKLSAIGMQPFYRPGSQRGFSYHLEKGEELKGLLYSFSFTREDSLATWNRFHQGNELWHEDFISKTAIDISEASCFTYNALNLCLKRYAPDRRTVNYKRQLQDMGFTFNRRCKWSIPEREFIAHLRRYEDQGGFVGINNVVQRKLVVGNHTYDCVRTEDLSHDEMLRLPNSGCPAPFNYNSPISYVQSKDNMSWGVRYIDMQHMQQTMPNPVTRKVDKWMGNWRTDIKLDYTCHNRIRKKIVKV